MPTPFLALFYSTLAIWARVVSYVLEHAAALLLGLASDAAPASSPLPTVFVNIQNARGFAMPDIGGGGLLGLLLIGIGLLLAAFIAWDEWGPARSRRWRRLGLSACECSPPSKRRGPIALSLELTRARMVVSWLPARSRC